MTNIVLDMLLVAVFPMGLAGAAVATSVSQLVGGLAPVFYFARKNSSLLRLGKTRCYGRVLLRACTNGSSELMSNISSSVVTILYNFQLMRLAGDDGIAAYGAVMYVAFIFAAISIGYAVGSAPLIGYHYGAGNSGELQSLLRKSLVLTGVAGAAMAALAAAAASPLAGIFVGYDRELFDITVHGMRLFSVSFLFSGFNIFASSFFTALNNGFVSAAISFLRTLVFQCAGVLILPAFLELDGIWLSVTAAEIAALVVSMLFFAANRRTYQY